MTIKSRSTSEDGTDDPPRRPRWKSILKWFGLYILAQVVAGFAVGALRIESRDVHTALYGLLTIAILTGLIVYHRTVVMRRSGGNARSPGAERIAMSKRPITKWLIRAGLFGLAGLLTTSAYLIGVNEGHRRAAASPAVKACESALAYTLTHLNGTNGRAPERHVAHPLSGIDWTIAVANEGPPNFHKQVIATSELPDGQRAACLMTAARRPDGRWEHRP